MQFYWALLNLSLFYSGVIERSMTKHSHKVSIIKESISYKDAGKYECGSYNTSKIRQITDNFFVLSVTGVFLIL